MKQNILALALVALVAGTAVIGCGETEDYTSTDTEYATMEEATLAAHEAALASYGEMNTALNSVTVADDWDEAHTNAYSAAQAKMTEYQTKFDEAGTQVAALKADLEAAKAEGREAYDAKLAEAKQWHTDYMAWLETYNADVETWKASANAEEGSEPWWFVAYGTPETEVAGDDMAEGDANADPDGDGVENEEADGIEDDVEAVKEAGKDVLDAASDAIGDDPND